MRTIVTSFILTLPILILALCVGCPKTAPKSNKDTTPALKTTSDNDFSKPEPLVIPLEPRVDPPEEVTPPEETTEEQSAPPETTGVLAKSFGKYATESIPLPPIDDLTAQLDEYMLKLGTNLESLEGNTRYAADAIDIVRDANALSLVAQAIGLTEVDSKYKKSAPQIIVAAQNLAAAKNYDDGQKAYAGLKSALSSTGGGAPLSWSVKVAHLPPLMKAVPNLSSTVKRLTNTERKLTVLLERKPQQVYGALAALAAISQGSMANVSETSRPDAVAEWKKYCEEFRDTALKANAVTRQFAESQADYGTFKTAIDAMSASCDHCHEVFYPSAVGQE